MIRYSILVVGRVQGVGFRFFAQTTATNFSITGFAKNLENGNVELEIQGSDKDIKNFLDIICKGNRYISVTELTKKEIPIMEKEYFFNIIH